MLKPGERLAEAGARLLFSKTVETYVKIICSAATLAIVSLIAVWTLYQVRSLAALMGM